MVTLSMTLISADYNIEVDLFKNNSHNLIMWIGSCAGVYTSAIVYLAEDDYVSISAVNLTENQTFKISGDATENIIRVLKVA